MLAACAELFLVFTFMLVLGVAVFLTVHSRGIQFRGLRLMAQLLIRRSPKTQTATVSSRRALFAAMSTTIGIGNIVGPIVAMGFGGPGALVCYVLASVFGAATTFSEVSLALRYRSVRQDGGIDGGPMPYLRAGLAPLAAKIYAACGCLLLLGWSTNQSNTLGGLLAPHGVSPVATGLFLACTVMLVLLGGVQTVAALSARLVPVMCLLYCGATCYVILCHIDRLPAVTHMILTGFWKPQALVSGVGVHTAVEMLRWGLARAVQANEAGVGTATIVHSQTSGTSRVEQGVLAMASVYANGFLCVLTGVTVLVSDAWQAPEASFDITLLAQVFLDHLPRLGPWPLIGCAFMFAFGTIVGNCYNGGQCFLYLVSRRRLIWYQVASAVTVFLGTLCDLRFVWSLVDFLILPVVLLHLFVVLRLTLQGKVSFDTRATA